MIIPTDQSFPNLMRRVTLLFLTQAERVHTMRWQGVDISKRPDMVSYELMNFHCLVRIPTTDLADLRDMIKPNIPWADDHFLERVGGEPLNPGVQWANWPWASSADRHRDSTARFNHTYMERLWPKWAGMTLGGKLPVHAKGIPHSRRYPRDSDYFLNNEDGAGTEVEQHQGIRWSYGDLQSLVELLAEEPDTRQAWIPLFFPEDTGKGDGGRKPCTLGYQFLVRNNQLHIFYPLRSCDFIRHFRDDIYLAIRLLLWVRECCQWINPAAWDKIGVGTYAMHCTSLHVFENDMAQLRKEA